MENSLDFLEESLKQYLIADESYTHQEEFCKVDNKKKWKMAFINLVQATELLMKYILSETAWALLEVNIDKPSNEEKTITFSQCVSRIRKFSSIELLDEDSAYLNNCSKLRNRFVHFVVDTSSEEIKPKYAGLFVLYKKIFEEKQNKKLSVNGIKDSVIEDLILFEREFIIYRGQEIRKSDLQDYKDELEEAQIHSNFVDKRGRVIQRIKFGMEDSVSCDDEKSSFNRFFKSDIYKFSYCGDCGTKQGEYHLHGCDLERCPICGRQPFVCDCGLEWEGWEET